MAVQCGLERTGSPPFSPQAWVESKSGLAFEPGVDRPCQWMSQDRQGFALARFVLQAGQEWLGGGMLPQASHGGFGKGPRERGMTDWTPRGAGAFPRRCFGTLDATTRRGTILHPWEALASMHVVEQHAAADLADAGHRVAQIQGLGVMVLGGGDDGACDVTQQRIVGGDERKIDCHTFLYRWIGTALGDPVTVGFGGDLCANGGQGRLAVGMVDMGEECAACACQGHASAQQVAGGAPLGGVDRGLGEPTAAQQHGDCVGVDRVVCGFAAMNGLHVQGMPKHKRDPVVSTEVSQPVPGKQACGREDDLRAVGRDGLAQRLRGGWHVTVQPRFPGLVEEAQVHGAGVEIDPTIQRVRLGGESPGGLLLVRYEGLPLSAYHGGLLGRGPQ
jgi:hypothetical protein